LVTKIHSRYLDTFNNPRTRIPADTTERVNALRHKHRVRNLDHVSQVIALLLPLKRRIELSIQRIQVERKVLSQRLNTRPIQVQSVVLGQSVKPDSVFGIDEETARVHEVAPVHAAPIPERVVDLIRDYDVSVGILGYDSGAVHLSEREYLANGVHEAGEGIDDDVRVVMRYVVCSHVHQDIGVRIVVGVLVRLYDLVLDRLDRRTRYTQFVILPGVHQPIRVDVLNHRVANQEEFTGALVARAAAAYRLRQRGLECVAECGRAPEPLGMLLRGGRGGRRHRGLAATV